MCSAGAYVLDAYAKKALRRLCRGRVIIYCFLLRWFGALSFAIQAATFILFPLHWTLVIKFGVDIGWARSLKHLLAPFLSAWAFVAAGISVAPNFKLKTSYALAAIWICFTIVTVTYTVRDDIGNPKYCGLSSFGGIVGATLGRCKVKENLSNVSSS